MCQVFIDSGGLIICMDILTKNIDNDLVESIILRLLNNIVEVPDLRTMLINDDVMSHLRYLKLLK